ncbi:iron dicitrate transport regulator FecR, partial [Sinorhizobium meliloti]
MRQFEMRRRIFLGGLLLATVSGGRSTAAAPVVGKAAKIRGNVRRRQGGDEERLAIGGAVLDKDYV